MAQADNNIPLGDCFSIPDVFATELANVEILGPCTRLTFAIRQRKQFGDGEERTPIIKVILPSEAVRDMIMHLPALLSGGPVQHPHEVGTTLN